MTDYRQQLAAKFGARNSASDADRLQRIHDLAVENGAACGGHEAPAVDLPAEIPGAAYAKSLGLDTLPDLAIKRSGDEIRGYLAIWGNPDRVDLDREYFTPETDFWDTYLKSHAMPLTYDHAQDETTKSDPVIGRVVEWGDDPVGRWYVAQLDKMHRYRKAVDMLIEQGAGTSSDSAPQYVLREKRGKGVWLKRWPMLAAAITPTPCEPRQLGTVDWKSYGIVLPDTLDWEWQVAKVKRLKAELSFMETK